jgi:ligand-binding sensor domain-containing protein
MKPIISLLIPVLILVCPINEINAQWVETNGPYNVGEIRSLAVSGTDVFAGTDSGVFRRTNDGGSWSAVNTCLPSGQINALLASGTNLFAGTYDGVFLSSNNGTSWVHRGLSLEHVGAFVVSANGSGGTNLFAGTWTQGFLLFTLSGGVWRSTNNGTSWTDISKGRRMDVKALAIAQTGDLFSGGTPFIEWFLFLPLPGAGGVFRYGNDDISWTPVNSGLANTSVYSLVTSGSNLFAGTGGGVFRSTNNGASWIAVSNGLTNYDVSCLVVSGTNLLAGTRGGGVFRSTDNGASWTAVNNGLTNLHVYSLAVSSTNLFAGTSGGVWRRPLSEMITSVEHISGGAVPEGFALEQNFPNPFNPSTTIQFSIPRAEYVTLKIYDLVGREVATLVSDHLNAGTYESTWNAKNTASGVYFYRLEAGQFSAMKKLLLVK